MKSKTINISNEKQVTLRFGFKAFAKYESAFGKPLEFGKDTTTSELPKIIWAGMVEELTVDDIENLIDESDISLIKITEDVAKAFNLALIGEEGKNA